MFKKMTPAQKTEAKWGLLFVAPTIIGLIVLNFYPIFNTIYQSFCKTGDFGKGNTFVGLANYAKVLQSSETWQSLWNTVKYAIIEVPFGIIIALVLAVLLNQKIADGLRTGSGCNGMEMALQYAVRSSEQYFPHQCCMDL